MIKQSFKFTIDSTTGESVDSIYGIAQDINVQLTSAFDLRLASQSGSDVSVYIAYKEIKGKIVLGDVILTGGNSPTVPPAEELAISPGSTRTIKIKCMVPESTDLNNPHPASSGGEWAIEIPGCYKSGFSESLTNISDKFYKTSSLIFDVKAKEDF